MNEISKEYLERLTETEVEWVEGGEGAFDDKDYEDEDEGISDDAEG